MATGTLAGNYTSDFCTPYCWLSPSEMKQSLHTTLNNGTRPKMLVRGNIPRVCVTAKKDIFRYKPTQYNVLAKTFQTEIIGICSILNAVWFWRKSSTCHDPNFNRKLLRLKPRHYAAVFIQGFSKSPWKSYKVWLAQ